MDKTTIITLSVVVLLVLGGLFVWTAYTEEEQEMEEEIDETEEVVDRENGDESEGDEEQASEDDSEESDLHTVTYTDAGFSPERVEVNLGDTVVFENESSSDMWVASDPHPSHTDFPEFDQRGGVGQGERFEFTFEEEGEWGYHDHLTPDNGGVVAVE